MNPIEEWSDAFENQVGSRTNVLDIAAHYPYSPERLRLFVDGSRVFPEYGAVSQYDHTDDTHDLQPAGGETVTLESTERPRYVVQYELAATWAFAVNQDLATGDSIRVGLYDGTDGWYMEHTGAQSPTAADFVLERNGSEVYRESDVDIHKTVRTNARLKLQTGWYDVTRQRWERSFPSNGGQQNPVIGEFSADDERGSRYGNLPLHFSVTAAAGTSGLTLHAGSAAQVNLGRTTSFTRAQTAMLSGLSIGSTGTWVPLAALRIDPDRHIVNTQLTVLQPMEYSEAADVQLMALAVDPSNTDASGWTTPPEHSAENSVVEYTESVSTLPDSTGTVGPSATAPGGYQVGYGSLYTSGTGSKMAQSTANRTPKRELSGRDVVLLVGTSDTTGDVTLEYQTEQDW